MNAGCKAQKCDLHQIWFENPNLQLRPSRELNPAIQSVRATLLKDECNDETVEAKPDFARVKLDAGCRATPPLRAYSTGYRVDCRIAASLPQRTTSIARKSARHG